MFVISNVGHFRNIKNESVFVEIKKIFYQYIILCTCYDLKFVMVAMGNCSFNQNGIITSD